MKAKKENVRNKSSARRKLIPAISMLTVSAIMLSTATYAWFTMNKKVEMTGLNMTASTGEGMDIALAEVSSSGGLTFSKTITNDDAETNLGWKDAVKVDEYYSDIGKLKPASSADGKNFFDATDASNGGRTATKFTKIELNETNMAQLSPRTTITPDSEMGSTAGHDGYYVDIPVHLRTSKAKTADKGSESIYYKMVINNNETGDKATNELYKAVRVAFINGDTAGAISGADDKYYDHGDSSGGVTSTTGEWTAVSSLHTDAVYNAQTDETYKSGNGVDSGLTISLAETSGKYGHLDFVVRVWLEGESKLCFNENAGQQWNIDFKFSLGQFGKNSEGSTENTGEAT